MFHDTFSPNFSNYMLWSQKLKMCPKLSEWNWRNFSPTNVCFLMWSIKWRCKQITKKKTVFVSKISFAGCLYVGNVSITHRGHLFYFRFMESTDYLLFSSNFSCPYLGASLFGRPPILRKQFALDSALMADMIFL